MAVIRWGRWLALVVMAAWPCASGAAQLSGQVHHVGYAGAIRDSQGSGQDLCRLGDWVPVRIELTNTDGDLFDGSILVRQIDRDGDTVVARRQVAVRGTSKYYLYIPSGRTASGPDAETSYSVQVLDKEGRPGPLIDDAGKAITRLKPTREVRVLSTDHCFVLDISARPLNQLSRLLQEENVTPPLAICRASASELPDSVAGLSMVNVIVWDGADPSQMDVAQREALLEWNRRGGTLILGVGKNWEMLARSRFADVLPARLTGTASIQEMPELRLLLFGNTTATLTRNLSIATVRSSQLLPGARVIEPSGQDDAGSSADAQLYVTSRACDQGQIVLVSVEMSDMFTEATKGVTAFLQRLMPIRLTSEKEDPNQHHYFGRRPANFFRYVESAIAFQDISSGYFLASLVFVGGYVAISTIGLWTWLRRRQMSRHSWTAFALVAGLASGASVVAMQTIRWFGSGVRELSVVRCEASSDAATATCYFGYKTPTHLVQDVGVPADTQNTEGGELAAALRPLPTNPDDLNDSIYSAGLNYDAVAEVGELRGLPMRATLKQFESRWHGKIAGQVQASLVRERVGSNSLSGQSWIQNNLPCDLWECVLLVASRDISSVSSDGSVNYRNANNTTIYRVPNMPRGVRINWAEWMQAKAFRSDVLLSSAQNEWLADASFIRRNYQDSGEPKMSASARVCALRLLATFQELNRRSYQDYEFERSNGQELDCMNRLGRDTAILLAFSNEPGPARLCVRKAGADHLRMKPLEPREARVMYQVAIPLQSP